MNTKNITKDELTKDLYGFCSGYYEEDDSGVDKLFDAFTIELVDGEQVASFSIDKYKGDKDKLYDYFKPHQGNINTHLDEMFLDYLNNN
jgi:hypothetical protein